MGTRAEGKIALISGGARGQGEAEARLLVSEGAQVVIGDVLADDGRAVAEDLGSACTFVELDVTDPVSWDEAVSAATARSRELGRSCARECPGASRR